MDKATTTPAATAGDGQAEAEKRERKRGRGEACPRCESHHTFVRTSREVFRRQRDGRRYPSFVLRRTYWECGMCRGRFTTDDEDASHRCACSDCGRELRG